MATSISAEDMEKIKNGFDDFRAGVMTGPPGSRPVSSVAALSPPSDTDGTSNWFHPWKAMLAAIVGGAAGAGVVGGTFWCSAGGVYISGPFGFSLAAGYFTGAGAVGIAGAGGATVLAAAAAV
ncbi:hypothetical protein QBC46DRAFT_430646, partial [Diplogelasinospora grovesii]